MLDCCLLSIAQKYEWYRYGTVCNEKENLKNFCTPIWVCPLVVYPFGFLQSYHLSEYVGSSWTKSSIVIISWRYYISAVFVSASIHMSVSITRQSNNLDRIGSMQRKVWNRLCLLEELRPRIRSEFPSVLPYLL
jgi:hypothetical protein